MTAGSQFPLAQKRHSGQGRAFALRLVLRWSLLLFSFVSLGLSLRTAFVTYQTIAPTLHAMTAGLSTARSALDHAGIHNPLQLLPLS